ncbi:nickel pincer cofactor biosynthesis protein LarB [soil metagenome]
MDPKRLRELLDKVAKNEASVDEAVGELRELPFAELGFATVDHHRALRQGMAEVILGQGKTPEQIARIAQELARKSQNVLVTRVSPEAAVLVRAFEPRLVYLELARTLTLEVSPLEPTSDRSVAVICAGTSDLPVVEECVETLRMMGVKSERVTDVGVAGIHRLLHKRDVFERSSVAIVIAGMEGALASAVGGMVDIPVIAVPTSVGYGASFGGVAALLGMLTSCASGVTVVNIDNGFGAAFAALRMLRMEKK